MAAIGTGWEDGAWVEAGWVSTAWSDVVGAVAQYRLRRQLARYSAETQKYGHYGS